MVSAALAAILVTVSAPLHPGDSAHVRIVDVGPGLCTITTVPGPHVMIYDAGHWNGRRCVEAARGLIPGGQVDLMVISHSDADHLGDADDILGEFRVRRFIHTGNERTTANYGRMVDSLAVEVVRDGGSVRNLGSHPIEPGERMSLGDATVTLVAGWHEWTRSNLSESESRNAISIVLRLDYAGRSVLYAGDAVGRRIGDPPDACKDAEAFMVENHRRGVVSLASDVLIAPHHGADNGNSHCFIDAVDPYWVVFSAGHDHGHPRADAADRYLAEGVPLDHLLRTDRGDDEADEPEEWKEGSIQNCTDTRGDDDVDLLIWEDGTLRVQHLQANGGC